MLSTSYHSSVKIAYNNSILGGGVTKEFPNPKQSYTTFGLDKILYRRANVSLRYKGALIF